jgi:insertion element IS1 protein InsB
VNHAVLQVLHPEHVEVEICRAEELDQRRGLTSELDEMWSYVRSKANPRWLWHAIDHHSGHVLAYVFGRRQDKVFLRLKALLEPFGLTRYYTDSLGRLHASPRPRRALPRQTQHAENRAQAFDLTDTH